MTKYDRLVGALLISVFLLAVVALTKTRPGSWNDLSRIAAIESLVERGTWSIDGSPFTALTKDKILLNGKFYSDKMPLFSFIGAGLYTFLHYELGMTLTLNCSLIGESEAYYWLTLILVGIPFVLTLGLFFDFARRQNVPLWIALGGTLALGIGTMIFPYALVFNHNAPSACLVFLSFYIVVTCAAKPARWLLLAGLAAALAISFDIVSSIMAMCVAWITLARYRSKVMFFALGAVIPLGLTAWLDFQIAGTIIPPYMIPGGFDWPGSVFSQTIAGLAAPDDKMSMAYRMFFGSNGLFAYNPLLLFALAGATGVALNRKHFLWIEGCVTTMGFLLLSFYLVNNTDRNPGGLAYGERWFMSTVPTLFSFIFFTPPLNAATMKNVILVLFVPLLGLSIFSTAQGIQEPWIYWPPPIPSVDAGNPSAYYALVRQRSVEQPLDIRYGSHLSAVGLTLIPTGTLEGGQAVHMLMYWHANGVPSQCYQMHAQIEDERGHLWTQETRAPLDGVLPTKRWVHQQGIIGEQYTFLLPPTMPPGNYTIKMSVYGLPASEVLPASSSTGQALGTEPQIATLQIKKNKSSITATELQQQFQLEKPYFVDMGDLRLIGFKPVDSTARRGEEISVGLYWRARSKPAGDYSVFVQLRDAAGIVILEQKGQPANGAYPTTAWSIGEVLLDWHDLIVPDSVAPGEYAIWIGLSNTANDRVLGETRLTSLSITR